jgi:hypothetical protein
VGDPGVDGRRWETDLQGVGSWGLGLNQDDSGQGQEAGNV